MATITCRAESPGDHEAVGAVNTAAFGQQDEARLVDALREGGFVRLSLVAEADGRVVGHVLFSALEVVGPRETFDALALAPLAVLPEFQRQGIGADLVRRGLVWCREAGHRAVFVVGDPAYYARFGFSAEAARRFDSPYEGEAFQVAELQPAALAAMQGEVRYPAPFAQL